MESIWAEHTSMTDFVNGLVALVDEEYSTTDQLHEAVEQFVLRQSILCGAVHKGRGVATLPNPFLDASPGLMQCVNSKDKDGMMPDIAWVLSILTLMHATPSKPMLVLLLPDALMHASRCC